MQALRSRLWMNLWNNSSHITIIKKKFKKGSEMFYIWYEFSMNTGEVMFKYYSISSPPRRTCNFFRIFFKEFKKK